MMKQNLRFLMLILLCAVFSAAWGETLSGMIEFGTNKVKINNASVTGTDNLNNTWTITTAGTTSFSPNSDYCQVGSKDSPATSITFTTTLPDERVTVTSLEAKFGGFASTAGTVTLVVGDETVGTGSLSGTNDVIVTSNSGTSVMGTVLTVTVTNISRGVKCYHIAYTYETSSEPTISVNPTSVNLSSGENSGTINVTYKNGVNKDNAQVLFYEVDGTTAATYDWMTAAVGTDGNIGYHVDPNTGEARSAYLKVYGLDAEANGVYSDLITITQAAPPVDYVTLPFEFDGNSNAISSIEGLTAEGIEESYNSSPKLKFDTTGDNLILHFNERPGTLTFDIKGNSFSGGTFKVQTSEDGTTFTDLKIYTSLSGTTTSETFENLGENVRYIKWVYTTRSSGNVALGNITLGEYGAHQEHGSGTIYEKVTTLRNGTYLIVYEDGNLAFNGSLETLDAVGNSIPVTISNNQISGDATIDAATFTYDATNNTLRSHSGYYIGQTSDANGLASDADNQYENTISFDNDGNANIVSSRAYLRYNSASNQERFRYYKSSSYTGQKAIQLYKQLVTYDFTINPLATDGTYYYATVSNLGEGYWTVPAGVTVSTVVVDNDGNLTYPFVASAGQRIPGDGAYLVKSTTSGIHSFVESTSTESVTIEGGNMLYSTGEGNFTTVGPDNGSYYFYKLARNSAGADNSVGFYWHKSDGSAFEYPTGHQAYLAVPQSLVHLTSSFTFDGTNGISEIETSSDTQQIYTISGVRVNSSQLTKGLYIINGKKVIIK